MKETITLNTQEQKRVMVLNRLLVGQLTATEGAELLSLSERQVRRLSAANRKGGAAALAHGNRGRKPIQSTSEEVRHQVIELANTTYEGCNYESNTQSDGTCTVHDWKDSTRSVATCDDLSAQQK